MTSRIVTSLKCWLVGAACAIVPSAQATPGDDPVAAAAEAFHLRDAPKLAMLAAQVDDPVLRPYVEYWQLDLGIDNATPEAVHAFVQRNPGGVLANQLKADWIRQLGTRGQWNAIPAEADGLVKPEDDVTCLMLQARVMAGQEYAASGALAIWDEIKPLPDTCLPLIERLVARGTITPEAVWQRGRKLLHADQVTAARQTYAYLPTREQPDYHVLALASVGPQRYLSSRKLALTTRAERETAIFAIDRLARDDAGEAGAYFNTKRQARFTQEERSYVFAQIGLHAARQHRPEAMAWFALADGASLSRDQRAWRARAALRAENWRAVRHSIEQMPADMRNEETWTYWYGRALQALGEPETARGHFAKIAERSSFYGRLAAEELGMVLQLPPRGYAPTTEDLKQVAQDPSLQRALALFRHDLRSDAVQEWNWGIRGFDDHQLLAAAELARRAQLWDRAINTADRTSSIHDYGLRFIAPYFENFILQARQQGLDDSWVLGLARQESRFIPNARSSAGAIGLMQLMPTTARLVGKRVGLTGLKPSEVEDVETNILLGTNYLREVLDKLDGQPLLASAAYNAGPNRADRWRGERPLEGAIYAETIPFSETRDYVKKVLCNAAYYAAILGRDPVSLKKLLGVVNPHGSTVAENAP